MERQVRARLGPVVFGVDQQTLSGSVLEELAKRGLTLAIGETFTGGAVARRMQEANGNRAVLDGVHLALDGGALARELSVDEAGEGAELASRLASALRSRHNVALGLAVVEGQEQQPQLHVALATPTELVLKQWNSRGKTDYAIQWATHYAIDTVRQWLGA
jgi:nicotinamide-nucleotide amidase